MAIGIMFVGFVLALYSLGMYMKESGRKMQWWKWVLSILWLAFVMMSAATVGTFIGEGASQAVLPGGGTMLAIILVSGAVLFWLLFIMKTNKEEKPTKTS